MADKKQKPTKYPDMFHLISPSKRFRILNMDPYVAEGRLAMAYRYFPGPVATRFFTELRDHKRIMGVRCPQCGTVYVPVEPTCGRCFQKMDEWVEVGREGVLQGFTRPHYTLPVHPGLEPLIYGIIKLDGADTGLLHLLGEVAYPDLERGMRMEAVFDEAPQGNILDIKYFRPVQGG